MLTCLKVSSLTRKRVFQRPEHNAKEDPMELNFEGFEMQKCNIPRDLAQRQRFQPTHEMKFPDNSVTISNQILRFPNNTL